MFLVFLGPILHKPPGQLCAWHLVPDQIVQQSPTPAPPTSGSGVVSMRQEPMAPEGFEAPGGVGQASMLSCAPAHGRGPGANWEIRLGHLLAAEVCHCPPGQHSMSQFSSLPVKMETVSSCSTPVGLLPDQSMLMCE